MPSVNKTRKAKTQRWRKLFVREVVRLIKQHTPCSDCGKKFHYEVMEFDHVRGNKTIAVSQLVIQRNSLSKVIREIEKCDLVCANCHRLRTVLRRNGTTEHTTTHLDKLGREADTARSKEDLHKIDETVNTYVNKLTNNSPN